VKSKVNDGDVVHPGLVAWKAAAVAMHWMH
jgi:hypothetical protein